MLLESVPTVVDTPMVTEPAVPPITTVASAPEGNVPVLMAVPITVARTCTPPAPDDNEPAVKVVVACPRPRIGVTAPAEITTTGETVSPPPVGLTMLNAIGQLPTGLPPMSVSVASNVDRLEVLLELGATTLGVDCSVSL